MKNLFYLNKYLVKYKWRFLLGIIFVALSNYFGVLIPQEIRKALDYVTEQIKLFKEGSDAAGGEINEVLIIFALTIVGFVIVKGILMYAMRQTIIVMSRLIEFDLRNEVFEHLQKMDLSFYKRNKTGDLMARISEDVNKVRMYLGPSILYGINITTLFTLTIYAMFRVNTTLAIYTLIPLPLLSISIYIVSSMINKRSSLIQKQLSVLNSTAQEVYSGIRVIKSYVKENQFGEYFAEQNQDYMEKSLSLARINAFFFPLMILLISASTLLTIFIGGVQVSKGLATPGNIAEFVIYVNMLTWPVTSIGWIASLIQQAEVSQGRINELLHEAPEIVNPTVNDHHLEGRITFNNVGFTYPNSGIRALNNVNFDLLPGQKMAVIGRTASGKSTIADLLLRQFEVTDGNILIDGKDIREHDLANLRRRIGYVPQDVFLFSDTVKNNIKFGKSDATSTEVELYSEHASVHEDILELPNQYDTTVGERGVSLSGGQKQRISIARAFIKSPDIIIMDDALSAIDTKTENKILSYLEKDLADKTAIIITHRIYNLLEFDKIIVIEDGHIVEDGTHNELLLKGGTYAELYEQQSIVEA
ncbi:MAG: ABC transporter ATP-binding protein [Saprospiraceae bacterium]|nr:ABC transporter ATP-binding protein [Saprospiraceae bacterium]